MPRLCRKLGDNVDLLKGNRSGNTGILFLVVYIFGFGIINVALAQDAINDKLDGIYSESLGKK